MVTTHQSAFRGQTTTRIIVLVAIALIVTGTSLRAQNPNPFGQPGVKPAPAPTPSQPAPLPSVLPTPEPLVVRLVRESNPSTPLELTRAVQLMIQTSQPKEAKRYLQQLVALKMTPQEKAELQRKFGTGLFLQFSREPDLQPEGAQVAEAVAEVEKLTGYKPATATEYRKVLEDKDIDAVSISTPNHWHALQTIWACQAMESVAIETGSILSTCPSRKPTFVVPK